MDTLDKMKVFNVLIIVMVTVCAFLCSGES